MQMTLGSVLGRSFIYLLTLTRQRLDCWSCDLIGRKDVCLRLFQQRTASLPKCKKMRLARRPEMVVSVSELSCRFNGIIECSSSYWEFDWWWYQPSYGSREAAENLSPTLIWHRTACGSLWDAFFISKLDLSFFSSSFLKRKESVQTLKTSHSFERQKP